MNEQEIQKRLKYCKDSIKDKKFKLVKWINNKKDWSHDHCDFCGVNISDKDSVENEGYANGDEDWFCKSCFEKYKGELEFEEIKK